MGIAIPVLPLRGSPLTAASYNGIWNTLGTESVRIDGTNMAPEALVHRHFAAGSITREAELRTSTTSANYNTIGAPGVQVNHGGTACRLIGAAGAGWQLAAGEYLLVRFSVELVTAPFQDNVTFQLYYQPNGGAATPVPETQRTMAYDDGAASGWVERGRCTIAHLFTLGGAGLIDWLELRTWHTAAPAAFYTLGPYTAEKLVYRR